MEGDHVLEAAWDRAGERDVSSSPDIEEGVIAGLARRRGWSPLFERLVRASLRRSGMIERTPGGTPRLTESGRRRGATVARNHLLWERYLTTHADVAPNHVDWSVDQVEHVLSPELVTNLEETLVAEGVDLPPREPSR